MCNVPQHPESKGIKYNDFLKYLNGVHPNVFVMTPSMGNLYYWDLENPSYLDLSGVMRKFSNPFGNPKLNITQRIKRRIKKLIS